MARSMPTRTCSSPFEARSTGAILEASREKPEVACWERKRTQAFYAALGHSAGESSEFHQHGQKRHEALLTYVPHTARFPAFSQVEVQANRERITGVVGIAVYTEYCRSH